MGLAASLTLTDGGSPDEQPAQEGRLERVDGAATSRRLLPSTNRTMLRVPAPLAMAISGTLSPVVSNAATRTSPV